MTADYYGNRITLYNAGPATARQVRVRSAANGPRGHGKVVPDLKHWEPVDLVADTSFDLRVFNRELLGDYVDLTIEWLDGDGSRREHSQRVNWAG